MDIDRAGATYSVDTLRDLHAEHPHAELYFITGADALGAMLTWRDPQEALALAHMVGVTRPGHDLSTSHLPPGTASVVEVPAMAISSTDCRERVARGAPISYLVPAGVERFITKMGLYRSQAPAAGSLG